MISSDAVSPKPNTQVRWEWIGDAWKLFAKEPVTWVGALVLFLVVAGLVVGVPAGLLALSTGLFAAGSSEVNPVGIAALVGTSLIFVIGILGLALLVSSYLVSGLYRMAIKQARGEAISVGDLFSGGGSFLRVLGVMFITVIAQIIVLAAFAIAGLDEGALAPISGLFNNLIAAVINGFFFFAIPLIIHGDLGTIEAIKTSIATTKGQWWMFALFAFVTYLLAGIGIIGCIIGIFVTLPFYFLIPAVAYRDTFGLAGAQRYEQFAAPPAPPSYWSTPSVADLTPTAPMTPASAPTLLSAPDETATCPNCGNTVRADAKFCNQCGNLLR